MSEEHGTLDQTATKPGSSKHKRELIRCSGQRSLLPPTSLPDPTVAPKPKKPNKKHLKQEAEARIKNAGDQVLYQAMLQESEKACDELRDLPAAGVQHDEVEKHLSAAQKIANAVPFENNFTAARRYLQQAKIGDLLKKGRKENQGARETAAETFKSQMEQAAALQKLAAETSNLTDAIQAGFQRRAGQAVAPLLTFERAPTRKSEMAGYNKKKDLMASTASGLIMDATNELKALNVQCSAAKIRAEKMMHEGEDPLKTLKPPLLTIEELAEHGLYLRGAKTLLGERDYRGAAEALKTLHDTVMEAQRGVDKAANDWQQIVSTMLDPLMRRAKILADNTAVPILNNTAPLAKDTFDTLSGLKVAVEKGTLQPSQAVEAYKNSAMEVVSNEYRSSQFIKFAGARKKVEPLVNAARDDAIVAIRQLDEALAKIDMQGFDPAKISGQFKSRLAKMNKDFGVLTQTAINPEDLDAKNFIELFKSLAHEALDAALPKRLGEIAGEIKVEERDAARAEKRNELADLLNRCSNMLDELTTIDSEEGESKQALFDTLSKMPTHNRTRISKAHTGAEALILEIGNLIEQKKRDVEKLHLEIEPMLSSAANRLKEMKTLMMDKGKNDDHAELVDDFTSQHAELTLLAASSDTEILRETKDLVTELLKQIEAGIDVVKGKDRDGKFILTVAAMRKEIKKRSDRMAGSLLPTYLGVTQATLQGELDEIGEMASGMLPPATYAKLMEWDKSYAAAERDALKAKAAHDLLVGSAGNIRKHLKASEFSNAKCYCTSIEARLQGILDSGLDEGEQNQAQKALSTLYIEVTSAKTDPATVLTGESDARAAEEKKKVDERQWRQMHKLFEERVTEQTPWRSKPRKELMALAKGADKTFEANGDLQAAEKQLAFAARRADFYKANPEGLELAARQSMPKVVAGWKNAVIGLKVAMDGVAKVISELPGPDLADPDKKAVATEINLMKALINPAAFDSVAAALQDKKRNEDDMRGTRETALAEALRMKDYFEKDSRFVALAINTFDSGLFKAANVEARLHLLKVEKTLLTSL